MGVYETMSDRVWGRHNTRWYGRGEENIKAGTSKRKNYSGGRDDKKKQRTLRESQVEDIQCAATLTGSWLLGTTGIPLESFADASIGVYNGGTTLNPSDRQPSPVAAACSRSSSLLIHPRS